MRKLSCSDHHRACLLGARGDQERLPGGQAGRLRSWRPVRAVSSPYTCLLIGVGEAAHRRPRCLPTRVGPPSHPRAICRLLPSPGRRAGARGCLAPALVASCTCGPWKSSTNAGVKPWRRKGAGPGRRPRGREAMAAFPGGTAPPCTVLRTNRPLSEPSWGRPGAGHCWKRRLQGRRCSTPGHRAPEQGQALSSAVCGHQQRPQQCHSRGLRPREVPWGPFVHSRGHLPPSWS